VVKSSTYFRAVSERVVKSATDDAALGTRVPRRLATGRAAAQIADLFRTTHKVKTQQVARSRGQRCGDIELASYLAMRRVRCLWYWISSSPTKDLEVALTLVLMDACITRMTEMGHLVRLFLTKYANTTQTIIIVPLTLSPS